jgi:hypothetical protein
MIEIEWLLSLVMVFRQAEEHGLADFVALTLQTIAVTAIKQTDYLQKQNGQGNCGQFSFDSYEYHFMYF